MRTSNSTVKHPNFSPNRLILNFSNCQKAERTYKDTNTTNTQTTTVARTNVHINFSNCLCLAMSFAGIKSCIEDFDYRACKYYPTRTNLDMFFYQDQFCCNIGIMSSKIYISTIYKAKNLHITLTAVLT